MYSAACLICAIQFATAVHPVSKPVEWLSPLRYDFGVIPLSVPVSTRFEFINTGFSPLVIDNVRTPCGCTAVEWPEKPIAPGEKASILVEYNAAKSGYFFKEISVFFHGIRQATRLSVEGSVVR